MADKVIVLVGGVPTEKELTVVSAGAADAGEGVALDAAGRLDESVMPTGIGADVKVLTASEALSAGDIVNIWDDAGTAKVRKADADVYAKRAMGFVKDNVSSDASATVYLEGQITGLSGMTPGADQFLSETAGALTETVPTTSGAIAQIVGQALDATTLNFEPQQAIVLA